MIEQKVTLKHLRRGVNYVFDVKHALSVLLEQKKAGGDGWKVDDPKWKFDGKELIRNANSGRNLAKGK